MVFLVCGFHSVVEICLCINYTSLSDSSQRQISFLRKPFALNYFYSNSGRAGFLKLSICYVLPPPHYLFSVYLQSIKESVTKIALLPTCKEAD